MMQGLGARGSGRGPEKRLGLPISPPARCRFVRSRSQLVLTRAPRPESRALVLALRAPPHG